MTDEPSSENLIASGKVAWAILILGGVATIMFVVMEFTRPETPAFEGPALNDTTGNTTIPSLNDTLRKVNLTELVDEIEQQDEGERNGEGIKNKL